MKRRIAKKIAKYAGTRPVRIGLVWRAGLVLSKWQNCYYGKSCEVMVNGIVRTGRIVCDPPSSATIILRDDGSVQRGGMYRVA